MKFNRESAVEKARIDLAERTGAGADEIETISVDETDFPDMSLGAPATDEMSAQMISTGWRINLRTGGRDFEYRADKYQLRLYNFDGANYVIES